MHVKADLVGQNGPVYVRTLQYNRWTESETRVRINFGLNDTGKTATQENDGKSINQSQLICKILSWLISLYLIDCLLLIT